MRPRTLEEFEGQSGIIADGRLLRRAIKADRVGNLILHLCGNTTQWILAEFTMLEDARDRDGEFAARGGVTAAELCDRLGAVYRAACDAVDRVPVDELLAPRTVQGYRETGLSAVLHVLEHSSGHAGQIYAWTKQAADSDLAFYDL